MTVAELIAQLSTFVPSAEVRIALTGSDSKDILGVGYDDPQNVYIMTADY